MQDARTALPLRRLAMALPAVFLLHVLEEAPHFVDWFNSLVARGISTPLFLSVNVVAGLITLALAATIVSAPGPGSGLLLSAWVGFLMLANGLFHIAGTLAHGRYSPGVVTGTLVYLPVGVLTLRAVARETGAKAWVVILAACVGAVPMLVHGYLIVFRGSRLF
jgi:uncharacterized protein with HXXEE motif